MKKVILITGVSSGFGKQTAELLAVKGHVVYGTVRRDTEISSLVNGLKLDITNFLEPSFILIQMMSIGPFQAKRPGWHILLLPDYGRQELRFLPFCDTLQ